MKIAVLKGGRSLERGVSLRSGARVEDALSRLGHEPLPLDVECGGADGLSKVFSCSDQACGAVRLPICEQAGQALQSPRQP